MTSNVLLAVLAVVGVLLLFAPVALQSFVVSRARKAAIISEPAEAVPGGGWPVAGAFQAVGFVPVGAVRIVAPSVPEQHCLLLAAPEVASFARLWVGPDGKTGGYSLQSPLPFGTLVTGVDAVDAMTDHELLQVFPGADPQHLLDRHLDAQWFLASLGVQGLPVHPADADARFRAEWAEELEAVGRRGMGFTIGLAYRSALKLPKHKGPLAEQKGIVEHVRRLQGSAGTTPPTR
ncbi:MAG: hypothetical protein R2726_14065 [Acidimicrobiales bacterium]